MPGKPPYFPFYPRDFASDGKVEAMTTEEVGAYILLLCKAWQEEPAGSIPADDTILARWARLDAAAWARCRTAVLAAFVLGTDGRYHQKRLREEFNKLRKMLKGRSEGGKAGAQKRWSKVPRDGLPNGSPITDPLGKGMGAAFVSVSESSQRGVQGGEFALPPSLDTPEFRAAWDSWVTYRKERRQKLTPSTVAKQIKQLAEWGSAKAVASIEMSIRNGWQGLFEPGKRPGEPANGLFTPLESPEQKAERIRREREERRRQDEGALPLEEAIQRLKARGGPPPGGEACEPRT